MRQGQNHAAVIIAVTDLALKLKDIVEGGQRRKGMNHILGNDLVLGVGRTEGKG